MNTKKVQPLYEAAHCLYASKMNLIPKGRFMGSMGVGDPAIFCMSEIDAFDIDYEWQFYVAEELYKMRDKLYEKDSILGY
jgi:CMP-N-acetylneuraminic acid synthetase